jgi:hypothetical protein
LTYFKFYAFNADSSIKLPSTPISAIVSGKLDFQVKVRVIHLWIVPDLMKPTEDGTIQMLFLDDKVSILCLYLNALYIFLNLVYVYNI